jgi:hypothetical protein
MSRQIKRIGVIGSALLTVGAAMAMQMSPSLAAPLTSNSRPMIVNVGPPRVQPDAQVPCGVQFTFTLNPNQTAQFFTFGWNPADTTVWTVMNDTNNANNPAVSLTNVATQRTSSTAVTYWLTVQNLTSASQAIEGRFCTLHR